MLTALKLWLLLFLVYVGTPRPVSFRDCIKGLFCPRPHATEEERMCLLGNSPESSDCRDDYELLGFMPADTIDENISRRIERTAEKFQKPLGEGIYLIDKISTALHFGSRHFGNGGSKKVAICSVYAPRKQYLNTWSKIYVPRFIYDKKTSRHYDQIYLSREDTMRYLQSLVKDTGVQSGEVFITHRVSNIMNNEIQWGYLMMVSTSKFKDLRFDCAKQPKRSSDEKARLDTDLQWESKLQDGTWKFANYKPTMDIVKIDQKSGEMRIMGSFDWSNFKFSPL